MSNVNLAIMVLLGALLSVILSVAHLLPFPGAIFLSFLAPLPLFCIGLSCGLKPAYGAGAIATLLIFLLQGPLLMGKFFIFSVVVPLFLISRALLRRNNASGHIVWYPARLLLRDFTFAIFVVMLVVLGGYLYLTHEGDFQSFAKILMAQIFPPNQMQEAEALFMLLFPILPGLFVFSWGLMTLINAALAQGLLVRLKLNMRPSPSIEDLVLPNSFLIAFGLFFALSFVGVGYVGLFGKNAAFVLSLPFFLVGLGLIHRWLHKTSYAIAGLAVLYLLLLLLFWPILFIILLGMLKPWIEKSA